MTNGEWEGEESFVCSRCEATFDSEEALREHVVETHGED